VAFAEIEKFIDTPVKHYPSIWLRASSSGMYVRLAFAVAGHLEPEILLVDAVLAVGDAQDFCFSPLFVAPRLPPRLPLPTIMRISVYPPAGCDDILAQKWAFGSVLSRYRDDFQAWGRVAERILEYLIRE